MQTKVGWLYRPASKGVWLTLPTTLRHSSSENLALTWKVPPWVAQPCSSPGRGLVRAGKDSLSLP